MNALSWMALNSVKKDITFILEIDLDIIDVLSRLNNNQKLIIKELSE